MKIFRNILTGSKRPEPVSRSAWKIMQRLNDVLKEPEKMNRIFTFTGMNTIFKRCVFASAAHALMAGEYTMLSSEISWDGDNYFFQDMEGCRGVIAFTRGLFVCGIQNIRTYTKETEEIVHTMLDGASEQVVWPAITTAQSFPPR